MYRSFQNDKHGGNDISKSSCMSKNYFRLHYRTLERMTWLSCWIQKIKTSNHVVNLVYDGNKNGAIFLQKYKIKSFVNFYIIHLHYNKIDIFKLIKDHHLNNTEWIHTFIKLNGIRYFYFHLLKRTAILNIFDIFW